MNGAGTRGLTTTNKMMTVELNEDNFLLLAAKAYDRSNCNGLKEFYDDLSRIRYIKGLLKRYKTTGKISERLLLNHFICLYNVFGHFTIPMLFYKIEKESWSQIKTFLVYLDYLRDNEYVTPSVRESDIILDQTIINILRGV